MKGIKFSHDCLKFKRNKSKQRHVHTRFGQLYLIDIIVHPTRVLNEQKAVFTTLRLHHLRKHDSTFQLLSDIRQDISEF